MVWAEDKTGQQLPIVACGMCQDGRSRDGDREVAGGTASLKSLLVRDEGSQKPRPNEFLVIWYRLTLNKHYLPILFWIGSPYIALAGLNPG